MTLWVTSSTFAPNALFCKARKVLLSERETIDRETIERGELNVGRKTDGE